MFYQEDRSMKNIRIKSKYFLFILLTCSACFDEYDATLDESFIHFDQPGVTVAEGSGETYEVTVTMAGPLLSSDLTLNYEIITENAGDTNFEISTPGTLVIPAGEITGSMTITPLDNEDIDGDKVITLIMSSTSADLTLGFPGPANQNSQFVFNIADDDCEFVLADFVGTYDVVITSETSFQNPAGIIEAQSNVTLGAEANTLVDDNFWGSRDFDGATGATTITIDPNTLDVTIPGQQRAYFNSSGLERSFVQGTQDPGIVISTCSPTFTVQFDLIRTSNGTIGNRAIMVYTKR